MDLRDLKEFTKDTLSYILTAGVVMFVIIYVVTLQQVVGPSMDSTLKNQDVVLLSKSHYKLFDMKRFDVIAFNYADTKYLIKRVIGLPGDIIYYMNNNLYINGVKTKEDFAHGNTDFFGEVHLKDNEYFVLGDNRENSLDSRKMGPFNRKQILGKTHYVLFPFNRFGDVE